MKKGMLLMAIVLLRGEQLLYAQIKNISIKEIPF
jgi:hypothetical protein